MLHTLHARPDPPGTQALENPGLLGVSGLFCRDELSQKHHTTTVGMQQIFELTLTFHPELVVR